MTRLRHGSPPRDPTGFEGPVLGSYRRWSENYDAEEWDAIRAASKNILKKDIPKRLTKPARSEPRSEVVKISYDGRGLKRKKAETANQTKLGKKPISKSNEISRSQGTELSQLPNKPFERRIDTQYVIAAEKAALRHFEITDNDRFEIGLKSSGWSQYAKLLTREFSILRHCRIRGADQIASVWNKKGFRTGARQVWTPRLVKIAKRLLNGSTHPER